MRYVLIATPLLLYAASSLAYSAGSTVGLIAPDGQPELLALALGLLTLGLRLFLLFAWVPLVAGGLAWRVAGRRGSP